MPALLPPLDQTRRLPLTGESSARGGDSAPPSLADTGIGPFSEATLVGVGGMGVVYKATAADGRTVAVKVIPVGAAGPRMDSTAARLEREWRTLATLDHPNVAQVFDSGHTADGRPYFTMEYIPGVPLGRYADEKRLTVRRRLELFQGVAAAVAFLHRRGIIHRDLKPGNVLVTEADGKPVPKLIDFGLAKLVGEAAGATTVGGYVGTPNYMAPEQATGKDTAVDTRADVYALGAILYELLAGCVPHARDTDGELGILELILRLQTTDPPAPSARLSEPAAAGRAAARGTTPAALRAELAGDLDRVTLKALARDREERYGTVEELAADVRRYLANESVSVGAPSRTRQFARFVRRNRALVAGLAAVVLLLTAAVAVTTSGLLRAREAEKLATEHLAEVERARAELAAAKEEIERTLRESQAARLLAEQELNRRRHEATDIGDERHMLRMDRVKAIPVVSAALRQLAASATHPDVHPTVRLALCRFAAENLVKTGDARAAIPLLTAAYTERRASHGDADPTVADLAFQLANAHGLTGRSDLGVPLLERHLPPFDPPGAPEPVTVLHRWIDLALGYKKKGQPAKTTDVYRKVLERGLPAYGADDPLMASAALDLAILTTDRAEAVRSADLVRQTVYRRQLSLFPNPADALYALGWAYQKAGRPDLAEPVYEDAIRRWATERPGCWRRHDLRGQLADLQARQGNFPDAIRTAIAAAEGLAVPPAEFDPRWRSHAVYARNRVIKLCVEWGDTATAKRWAWRYVPVVREPTPPPRPVAD